ncbi:MAG: TlpA family protein disulfide reductase [Spirochaetes bacterium]|nr:TlpA family protein disulfide reductase [Spirochaetota bacterium]
MRIKTILFCLLFFTLSFNFLHGKVKKRKAPDFSLYDLDKKVHRLSQKEYKGKIMILNFFATWCPPCRMEIPDFVEFYKKNESRDVRLVGICLDADNTARIKKFVKNYEINYPVLVGTRKVVEDYDGVNAIPTTFIIDDKGMIVDKIVGFTRKELLQAKIDDMIKIKESQDGKKKKKE